MPMPKENGRYAYEDYYSWDDGKRWELFEGIPHAMSPAPSPAHQGIARELVRQFGNFLLGKPCRVYAAPFDVRLNADSDDDTVVQPDVLVICDHTKIDYIFYYHKQTTSKRGG